ncbi:MAG: AAA family ATPase [Holosporaceae bacterium]|nr:AAA family ATPase [Holosporaceae bacterium]
MTEINSFDIPRNLIGFVNDPVSGQVINNVIKTIALDYSEVFQGTPADVIEFLDNNRVPKILVVDISNSELPLRDISKIKERSSPSVNIIAIGGKNDVGLFRDLMVIGVSDYLVKPLNNNLLLNSIKIVNGTINEYEKTGKMIQLINSVGGAGTTTVAANVGWILANRHFKHTLVLDLDFLYGTLDLILDIKTENSYIDILESPDKINDYSLETIFKRCGQRLFYLGGLANLFKEINVNLEAFEALLSLAKKQFNFILTDTQRGSTDINKICLDKTDSFVVLVEMSVASARNTGRILEFLNVKQPEKKVLIVANKIGLSDSGSLSKRSFEKAIDRKIDYMMPLDEKVALAAANIGQPLVLSNSPLTAVLENIASDLIGKNKSLETESVKQNNEGWIISKIKNLMPDIF